MDADASAHSLVPLVVLWALLSVASAHAKFGIPVVTFIEALDWEELEIANINVEYKLGVGRALVSTLALFIGNRPVLGVSVDIWASSSWGLLSVFACRHVEVVIGISWFLVVASAGAGVGVEVVVDTILSLNAGSVVLTLASAFSGVPDEAGVALLWEALALTLLEVEVESDSAVAVLWVGKA